MNPLGILHCSVTREDHGGIQSALWQHHKHEAELGFASRFLSYFDRQITWPGNCTTLSAHGWMTVGTMKRRFARAAAAPSADVAMYHDGWGLDWFAPLDAARRRIVFLHTEQSGSDELIRIYGPLVDGFLAVSRAYADRVRRVLPDFPTERVCALPYYVDSPVWADGPPETTTADNRLRLGYAGRIEAAHKRLDRLPALLGELDRRGMDYIFEVAGDGSYQEKLRRRLAGHPRLKFLGWLQGDAYWRAIGGWDAQVFFSDFEGFSRAGMEAMISRIPLVYPDFSPAAAELLGPTASAGLYPVGDMAAAAERIAGLAALGREGRRVLGQAGRAHLASHTVENYFENYRKFVTRIAAAPGRTQPPLPPIWHDWLPLGAYTRLFPQRF